MAEWGNYPRIFYWAGLLFCALTLMGLAWPSRVHAEVLAAWVQLVGQNSSSIRAVVAADDTCPAIVIDGEARQMQTRAEPGPIFSAGNVPPSAQFPIRVCEMAASTGPTKALLEGKALPLPNVEIRRVVLFGDTGCRIKRDKPVQNCNDPDEWPYGKLIKRAAETHPDLVIHVGDYLYRESCDERSAGCRNQRTGYGWDVWNADFFAPSRDLLRTAPWLMVRGNHESCQRAADGWFRFFYHSRLEPNCTEITPLFIGAAGDVGFVVLDSSAVAETRIIDDDDDETDAPEATGVVKSLRTQYLAVAPSIPRSAWLITHVPLSGIRVDKVTGEDRLDNPVLHQAIGDILGPEVALVVSGHIHLFEAISFGNGNLRRPPQLVIGTGGDHLAEQPKSPTELEGVVVARALIVRNFGYMVWDRDGAIWNGVLFDKEGAQLAHCVLAEAGLSCANEH